MSIEALKKEWDEFYNLPFPYSPAEEYLNDLFIELVDYDGYMAGIVMSFLNGVKVDKKLIYIKETLNEKLRSYKPLDSASEKSQKELIAYKNKLDKLVKLVLELYDKRN